MENLFEIVDDRHEVELAKVAVDSIITRFGDMGKDLMLEAASEIAAERHARISIEITSAAKSKQMVRELLQGFTEERFMVIWLDNQHRVISTKVLFKGTIDGCSVYPRVVVKEAIAASAASCFFAHNHPSGKSEASLADKQITSRLKDALNFIDVNVLDHLIVGKDVTSFAEQGLI